MTLDRTHDPAARSWVESANDAGTEFPIQNLPLGVFRRRGGGDAPRIGVAIGREVLDLVRLGEDGLLRDLSPAVSGALGDPSLNALMALGRPAASELRGRLSDLLRVDAPEARSAQSSLVPADQVDLLLPAAAGDYTDFYASVHHARNVGSMFRPDQPLLPNYKWVPIGYHGRASSLVASGAPVRRPWGQRQAESSDIPVVAPSRLLDYECEAGVWIAGENRLGEVVTMSGAEVRIFGLSLVNDWSARDIQSWEYQPLGPFLSKSFATTVSPWVVTLAALEPFRVPAAVRPEGDPAPLPYLSGESDRRRGGIDVSLEVRLSTERMRAEGLEPARLSRSRLASLYWTMGQLVTHHASNGCNLRPGDLLASGTVSGPEPDSLGCLLELTARGTRPLTLPTGESRRFLEDGDEVILSGTCSREGFVTIGFGACRGMVVPAAPNALPA